MSGGELLPDLLEKCDCRPHWGWGEDCLAVSMVTFVICKILYLDFDLKSCRYFELCTDIVVNEIVIDV